MRTFGVEEELLIVDPESGELLPLADELVAAQRGSEPTATNRLTTEFQLEQIEAVTRPHSRLADLTEDVRDGRLRADTAARTVGARVAALATSPLPAVLHTAREERPQAILSRFGLTARQQLTCGCHIHVSVESDDEGVAVLDRIRNWLPVLAALSSNSPFWDGETTGYASFRSQAWTRWPSTGPAEVYGSAETYRRRMQDYLATGVLLDRGMFYFDARLSSRYPTVEIRVADVCLEADDAVLLAALTRALVETAARQWRNGEPPDGTPMQVLRLAMWLAGKGGIEGELLHPLTARPCPAGDAATALLEHVRSSLDDAGDSDDVDRLLGGLLTRGTGSARQLRILAETGSPADVVKDAVTATNIGGTDADQSNAGL